LSACADCGAPAALAITEGGVTRELCAACAETRAGVPALGGLARALRRPRRRDGRCPHCGTTAEQATATGLVGCPLCYEALQETLIREVGLHRADGGADLW
jgi:protein-arginine kinase activator protein McsA